MSAKRQYTKRARADSERLTRHGILDATLAEWAAAGPAASTITAVAKRAGVQRLTVYRHFPDDGALIREAWDHLVSLNPPPDRSDLEAVTDPARRLRKALRQLYAHYRAAGDALGNAVHEAGRVAALTEVVAGHERYLDDVVVMLLAGWSARGKGGRPARLLEAALHHAVRRSTWRSLTAHGASDKDAARVIEKLVGALAKNAGK